MQSAWTLLEHPVISNDARTGWSNQFLNSQCEPETKPNFHRFCGQRRYLAKYVLKKKMKVSFYLLLIMLHKLLKEITCKILLFSGFWSWILGKCCSALSNSFGLLSSAKTTVTLQLTHMGCLKSYAFLWGFPWFVSTSLFSKLKILHLTHFCSLRKVEKQVSEHLSPYYLNEA